LLKNIPAQETATTALASHMQPPVGEYTMEYLNT
jgi:hypothetical protein